MRETKITMSRIYTIRNKYDNMCSNQFHAYNEIPCVIDPMEQIKNTQVNCIIYVQYKTNVITCADVYNKIPQNLKHIRILDSVVYYMHLRKLLKHDNGRKIHNNHHKQ